MRDYGKVYSSFWTSDDTRNLSDDGKLLALYLLTSNHTNIIGCFRLPDAYVSEDLGWATERVSKGFDELFRNGFATRHERSRWLVIHKFLRWNQIENPNQAKAARKAAESLPESSGVIGELAVALKEFCRFSEGWIANPSERVTQTVSKPETQQKQKQEQKQQQEQKADPRAPRSVGPEFEVFWQAYPRKVAKAEAEKAWLKLNPDQPLCSEIMAGLSVACRSAGWNKDAGQYVPHASTWLNGKRWTDKPESSGKHDLRGMDYSKGATADGRF